MDKENKPLHLGNLWALDQGAGWGGKLTLMDVNTHEYWQSDPVSTLYPD
jgi:serine/threonine protein phosphatase 1